MTIQQASIKSHDLETYRPFARKLYDTIRSTAPGAEVLIHQTWAYRVDDPRFTGQEKPGEPNTREAMYQGLTQAYHTIADELGVRVIPVGDAFHLADSDSKWGYRRDPSFDPKTAQRPNLPDQSRSLHVGWRWAGDAGLRYDGHHANMAGQYLGACVFYETLFQDDVTNNNFVPKGLDLEYARFLRQTAHRAVEAERTRQASFKP